MHQGFYRNASETEIIKLLNQRLQCRECHWEDSEHIGKLMMCAVEKESVQVLERLLTVPTADPSAKNNIILYEAVKRVKPKMVKMLTQHRRFRSDGVFHQCVCFASRNSLFNIFSHLVDGRGIPNIDFPWFLTRNPMLEGSEDLIIRVLQRPWLALDPDDQGRLLDYAQDYGWIRVVRMLTE